MKHFLLSLLLLLLVPGMLFSQLRKRKHFFEFQVGFGPTAMIADIGNPASGGHIELAGRYHINRRIGLKINLNGAMVYGADLGTVEEDRGYTFTSILAEPTFQFEYLILEEGRGYGKTKLIGYKPFLIPFVYVGGGAVSFYPGVVSDNEAIELDEFTPFTWVASGGIGFKHRRGRDWLWGFQAGGRYTGTDYLDGLVPQDSEKKDIYFQFSFILVYRF